MPTYSSPWALQQQWNGSVRPLSPNYSTPISGSGYQMYTPPPSNTGLSSSRPTQTSASGQALQPQGQPQQQQGMYGPAVDQALGGATNWSGAGQPGTNQQSPQGVGTYGQSNQGSDRQRAPTNPQTGGYYGTPGQFASDMYGTPQAQGYTNSLRDPGAYEQWYEQNASRYNQPTTLSSYYQSVAGKFGGQRFQPTNTRQAFNDTASTLRQPSYGVGNARGVSGELRQAGEGNGLMGQAAGMLQAPNLTSQYYQDNQAFFGQPGEIENYYGNNAQRFQTEGFGERYAQGILRDADLNSMYDTRLVGDELDYFRDPLRQESNSERLYNSGNQGLNTYYDRENKKAQEALANRMAAMGVFGSGETVAGMAEIDADLGAAQARDMAALAGQADTERRERAGLLMNFSGAAADEELARGGLMLDAAGTGLQLDRDAVARLYSGGQLANMSSVYGLDRVMGGGDLARSADDSVTNRGTALGNVGRDMESERRQRLDASGRLGIDADEQERSRLADYYDNARSLDQLDLDALTEDRQWVDLGGDLARQEDEGRLDWLNAGGDAADIAQDRREGRINDSFLNPLQLGRAMSGSYGEGSRSNTTEAGDMKTQFIEMLVNQSGMAADDAERLANQWVEMVKAGGSVAR